MKLHRFECLVFVVALVPSAWGQISLQPTQPQFLETVHVTAPASALAEYSPSDTSVTMTGNSIKVSVHLDAAPFGAPPLPLDVVLGQFPAGTYDVTVVTIGADGTTVVSNLGTANFTVPGRDKTKFMPLYDYSDHWWTPSESGWGITITQHISGDIFAAWFVYGSDGKPIWYVIPGGSWVGGAFVGTVYRTTGPYFGGVFNPANVATAQAGSGTLTFQDFGHATFSYNVDGVIGTKTIERLSF
jgi:hypothetical protein